MILRYGHIATIMCSYPTGRWDPAVHAYMERKKSGKPCVLSSNELSGNDLELRSVVCDIASSLSETAQFRDMHEAQFLAAIKLDRPLPLEPPKYPEMIVLVQVSILFVQK